MNQDKYIVWEDLGTGAFYLIPEDHILIPGTGRIRDQEGNILFVNLDTIQGFACEPEAVRAHLEQQLAQAMEQAKAAFVQLHTFVVASDERGDAPDATPPEEYFRQVMGSLLGAPPRLADADVSALDAFQKHVFGVGAMPSQLATLFPEEDQAAVFQGVMGRLREIAGKLDESVLKERDDPAAWVEVLYRELFADEIQSKKDAQRARIKASVSQSIAEGLRRQGLTPSVDFDREQEP